MLGSARGAGRVAEARGRALAHDGVGDARVSAGARVRGSCGDVLARKRWIGGGKPLESRCPICVGEVRVEKAALWCCCCWLHRINSKGTACAAVGVSGVVVWWLVVWWLACGEEETCWLQRDRSTFGDRN